MEFSIGTSLNSRLLFSFVALIILPLVITLFFLVALNWLEFKSISKLINLEIDLNSNQFKATKKNKVITKGKIIKATKENNNLEFKLVPIENSKSKDFGSGALINGLKC